MSDESQKRMQELYTRVLRLALAKDYDSCDRILTEYELDNLIEAIGLLRATYSIRENLPSWFLLLDQIKQHPDVELHLLRGIDPVVI